MAKRRRARSTVTQAHVGKWHVQISGDQREDVDAHLLAQAVMALGHQLETERRFTEWLLAQDERVAGLSLARQPVFTFEDEPFVMVDGGRLLCQLPDAVIGDALERHGGTPSGARRDRHYRQWVLAGIKQDQPRLPGLRGLQNCI